jgi:hypothetical protein
LYPTTDEEVLGVQVNDTLWDTGTETAVAVKFTPVTAAPLIVAIADDGVNVYPAWLGVRMYEPLARPEKLYFPVASVAVEPVLAPERLTVAADPLTCPEIPYVPVDGVDEVPGTKTRSTQ